MLVLALDWQFSSRVALWQEERQARADQETLHQFQQDLHTLRRLAAILPGIQNRSVEIKYFLRPLATTTIEPVAPAVQRGLVCTQTCRLAGSLSIKPGPQPRHRCHAWRHRCNCTAQSDCHSVPPPSLPLLRALPALQYCIQPQTLS